MHGGGEPFRKPTPNMQHENEADILHSWHRNAEAWTRVVREEGIESRRLVTDKAIVDAVLGLRPRSVLDVGCGEGWLVRALLAEGVSAIGVDAVPALIERASAAGGRFQIATYADLIAGHASHRVQAVVCNFSLLGAASVDHLLAALPRYLDDDGWLVVQTLHPWLACGEHAYADGWRVEAWAGFDVAFPAPAPWYFRTMASWIALFNATGWHVQQMREPLHPQHGRPASVLFMAQRR